MPGTSSGGTPVPLDSDPAGDIAQAVRNAVDSIEAAWVAYTPTFTNLSLGNGTVVARRKRFGKTFLVRAEIRGGSTTSASGAVTMSLPPGCTAHASGGQVISGNYESGSTITGGALFYIPASAATGQWFYLAPAISVVTSFGGSTAIFRIAGVVEAA